MLKGYIRLAAGGQPEDEQQAALARIEVDPAAIYTDTPAKRRKEGQPPFPERERLIRSLRKGQGDVVAVAEEGTLGAAPDDTLRALAQIAERGAVLKVARTGKVYTFEPSAAQVFDLLRDGEHQRRKRRAAHARVANNKMGKGGVPALRGRKKELARKAWHTEFERSGEDVARQFNVSRQTMYDTFGERGMPDATEKGRRR